MGLNSNIVTRLPNGLSDQALDTIFSSVPFPSSDLVGWYQYFNDFMNYLGATEWTITNANGFFVFRDEMSRGTLFGIPFRYSTQMPTNLGSGAQTEYMLVDMSEVVIGETESLMVDASTEASYLDQNGQTVSAYGQDQTVIRAITEHDLAVRRDQGVAVITTCDY